MKYRLSIDLEQAIVIEKATELLARLLMGQLDEVAYLFEGKLSTEHTQELKKKLKELEQIVKRRSINSKDVSDDARVSFDVYQVLRHQLMCDRHPGRTPQIGFDSPQPTASCPLPTVEVIQE